jgi:hypothetical protein
MVGLGVNIAKRCKGPGVNEISVPGKSPVQYMCIVNGYGQS